MNDSQRWKFNAYVNQSFRDIADQDYICARAAYKLKLTTQFFWSALQAIEKYLKAILLYNGKGTKSLSHNISKAYERVLHIEDIEFDFPTGMQEFIRHLNEQGINRYFQAPIRTYGKELKYFDMTVWHIRRYCYYLRDSITTPEGEEKDLFDVHIRSIQDKEMLKNPVKYRLVPGGFLEKILDNKNSKAREQLIWNNYYYGKHQRRFNPRMPINVTFGYPIYYHFSDIFPELDRLVQFPTEVKKYLGKNNVN